MTPHQLVRADYAAEVNPELARRTYQPAAALPPHNEIDRRLRLRGLNCPEFDTKASRAAKQFAQRLVAAATEVLRASTKPDKYERCLADAFLELPAEAAKDLDDGSAAEGWMP